MIDRKALRDDLVKQVKAVEADLGRQVKDAEAVLKPLRGEFDTAAKKAEAARASKAGEPAKQVEIPKWDVWLKEQLEPLSEDRADRVRAAEASAGRLRAEYDEARALERTAATWSAWLDERITQVAVAWVLGTVFVRFCEDNGLIENPYLTGADTERRDLAEARYAQYVDEDPDPTYRGWLERSFAELGAGQAGQLLFNRRHNPLFQIPVSHEGARELVEFWRRTDEAGALIHDFTDPLNEQGTQGWDTRFLGDLYQDLSEAARKSYALLQTPEFVEEFILDRTMDPVVRELGGGFGDLKMIDPTCGSGHFVLGAFRRMLNLWEQRRPEEDRYARVRASLDAVHGVDINPFAVAIARFRLLVAAMAAAGMRTLAQAGRYDWPIHLAVGDSLIKERHLSIFRLDEDPDDAQTEFIYSTEDVHEHKQILKPGRYDVVVGNPPYITVKDEKLNKKYRKLYKSCAGTYALSVPFAERFFELAKVGQTDGSGYGMVGQITANSFMKREFGTKLIKEFFAHKIELTEVIDTSGAFIPGHGTPTVILIGRRRWSARELTIRTVRSIQGEPASPKVAQEGVVWRSIVDQIDQPDSVSQWVSVGDLDRNHHFGRHPWILADHGLEMVTALHSAAASTLGARSESIGACAVTREDDAYMVGSGYLRRKRIPAAQQRPIVEGTQVRDYQISNPTISIWPYSNDGMNADASEETIRAIWPYRRQLQERTAFGKTQLQRGLSWFEYSMFFANRFGKDLSITVPETTTLNHFSLSRGEKVFKDTAPVIILKDGADDDEYLQTLGVLNSSSVCFWLKMNCHDKGIRGEGGGFTSSEWERFYQIKGANLGRIPLPAPFSSELVRHLDTLAQDLARVSPLTLTTLLELAPTASSLREYRTQWEFIRARMVSLQEELDWQVYSLYKLHGEDLRAPEAEVPELALGERAFEIVLARKVAKGEASGEWFKRHGSTPITEIPEHWPDAYKAIVQKRIDVIETSRAIGMIERPEYKRRWASEGWDVLQERALRSWLLDRLENRELWYQDDQPVLRSRAHLVSVLSLDEEFVSVAELYAPHTELDTVISDLLAPEHVPFLPALRYKPSGLKKRADWEQVWDLQRLEDDATDEAEREKIRKSIPVPPKYTSADFLKPSYWKARGKLDVPKERFISYATEAISGTPDLFGWAGWDHREQAQALAMYFTSHDDLSSATLTPLLAGLLELQPWLGQWHKEFDPMYSGSPAEFFAGYRANEQAKLDLSDDDLRNWRPVPAARRGRRAAKD
ncbi:BREX-2 system adenine-specific DNA-methyltransferase PglX [Streptomyces xiamenensis]|uniref:BREX-2 system adenine-specific DNA-methyltransferase PglX n=1 Tax=Streptomyces xiamenensis TaxID=408015 RepID=UPI0037CDC83F